MHNEAFVNAVKGKQRELGMNQVEFSNHLGVSEGALSKFYRRGVKDGIAIRVLVKFPGLLRFFASGVSNRN